MQHQRLQNLTTSLPFFQNMQASSTLVDSIEPKLPRLRSKSELARFVGRRVYFKDAMTVELSEKVCHAIILYITVLIVPCFNSGDCHPREDHRLQTASCPRQRCS